MKQTGKLTLSALAAALLLAACQQQTTAQKPASGAAPATAAASGEAASGAASGTAAPAGLDTEDKQISYLVGYQMATQFGLTEIEKNGVKIDQQAVLEAFNDQMAGKPSRVSPELQQKLEQSFSERVKANQQKAASAAQAEGDKYLNENKTKEGVKTTDSGLQYKVTKEGTGAQAALGDAIEVEYEGRLTDGTVFDGTKQHPEGKAFALPLVENAVIPGWIEGLQLMKEGGEYTLYIPAKLAYGERSPSPKIPANSVLVFDIKMKKVIKGGAKKMLQGIQEANQPQQQQPKKGK